MTLGTLPPASHLSSVALFTGQQGAVVATSSRPQTMVTWASGHSSTPTTTTAGLTVSPASEPFPPKLVDKTRSGQFVEMKEFLADNMALMQQLEAVPGMPPITMLGAMRPRLREITSLPTWCYCFLGYMAILTSDPPADLRSSTDQGGAAPRRNRVARL